jgi:integrase
MRSTPFLNWDPTEDLIRPKGLECLPDPVTDRELAQALACSDRWWTNVILLAAKAGLRASEIAALRRGDITEQVIFVRRAKGGNPESVPTDAELWKRLRSEDTGPIVGTILTGAQLSHRARRHFDRIGLPKVHLHRFRHWYAMQLLNAGANLRVVQECLRHRKVSSTQMYTLITSEQRRAAVNALPVLTGTPLPGSSRQGRPQTA